MARLVIDSRERDLIRHIAAKCGTYHVLSMPWAMCCAHAATPALARGSWKEKEQVRVLLFVFTLVISINGWVRGD